MHAEYRYIQTLKRQSRRRCRRLAPPQSFRQVRMSIKQIYTHMYTHTHIHIYTHITCKHTQSAASKSHIYRYQSGKHIYTYVHICTHITCPNIQSGASKKHIYICKCIHVNQVNTYTHIQTSYTSKHTKWSIKKPHT